MWMSNHTFHTEAECTPQVMEIYHHGSTNFTPQLPCTQVMEVIAVLRPQVMEVMKLGLRPSEQAAI